MKKSIEDKLKKQVKVPQKDAKSNVQSETQEHRDAKPSETISTTKSLRQATTGKDVAYLRSLRKVLTERKIRKLIINGKDVTPNLLETAKNIKFEHLTQTLNQSRWLSVGKRMRMLLPAISTLKTTVMADETNVPYSTAKATTIDDLLTEMSISVVSSEDEPIWKRRFSDIKFSKAKELESKSSPYIKIILTETEDFLLFEKVSTTVPKNSREANNVKADNEAYEHLTVGKGRVRRKADAETQTTEILYKTRYANTEKLKKEDAGTYVSNYDMYDTYAELEKTSTSAELDNQNIMDITSYTIPDGKDEMDKIMENPNFKLAVMLTQRLLAGNVFIDQQKRFRNMYMPNPLDLNIKYLYTLKELWSYPFLYDKKVAVSSMSWCPNNGDILAVAYGVYSFVPIAKQSKGYVGVWSIKNPVNPERIYKYRAPVTAVEFSQCNTKYLAIGLDNGAVEVRDITSMSEEPVASSHRETSPILDTVTEIKWIKTSNHPKSLRFLAASCDGAVMKYLINSPYLFGIHHMNLDRICGSPEGLYVDREESFIRADRNARALSLLFHPEKHDIYYILTDEGCLLECSNNYPQQHLQMLQVHEGSVYCMDFSPWSPKIYMTCGSDWCIRIWVAGIFSPIIKLTSTTGPVHCAYWSPTHSTIIASTTQQEIQIWDIRRNILKPVSIKTFDKEQLTIAKFSNCGRSLAVGTEQGKVYMYAFEDMPFPPYFQYEELENALMKAIRGYPELTKELKSVGYLGYVKSKKKAKTNI